MNRAQENYQFQKKLVAVTVVLFVGKILAWYFTHSVSVLTDALEYTINVVAGLVGLYSLYLASIPRDSNHPYGHGKVEFLSAAVEGSLMVVAGFVISYEAINNFLHPQPIGKLDIGIALTALTGFFNFGMGYLAVKKGEKNNSLALVATGKHMQSDTYTTVAIVVGLIAIHFTGQIWIDSTVALAMAILVIVTGYKVLRSSVAGIMDEADKELLVEMIAFLEKNRRDYWIDLHNLRIIKYGATLHLDCHLTVPWYLNVHQAHDEVDALDKLVKAEYGESVEMFVHTDGCLDFSCGVCGLKECTVRKMIQEKRVIWTIENVQSNLKHKITTE
jgi:cation diffusion facilitator family transporter